MRNATPGSAPCSSTRLTTIPQRGVDVPDGCATYPCPSYTSWIYSPGLSASRGVLPAVPHITLVPPLARLTRRQALPVFAGLLSLALIEACQSPAAPAATPTAANPLIKPRATNGADLTPVLASSELALGRNRVALGLIDAKNQPIIAGQVHVEFFKLNGQTAEKRSEGDASFRAVELQNKGIWVTPTTFDVVGPWGAQVSLTSSDGAPKVARLNFEVRERFSAPGYGDPAP